MFYMIALQSVKDDAITASLCFTVGEDIPQVNFKVIINSVKAQLVSN